MTIDMQALTSVLPDFVLDSMKRITYAWRKQTPTPPKAGTVVLHRDDKEGGAGFVIDVLQSKEYADYTDPLIKEALEEIYGAKEIYGVVVEWTDFDEKGVMHKSYGIHAPYMLEEVV